MPSTDPSAGAAALAQMLARVDVEHLLLPVLVQLAVIIAAARTAGVIARRLGQPAVVGEIVAGVLMGPSAFGALFPEVFRFVFKPHLEGVPDALAGAAFGKIFTVLAQLGLIFLLFLIGLEFDFSHLRVKGRAAVAICVAGMVLPFALGAGLAPAIHGYLEPHDRTGEPVPLFGLTLFLGTALSITALPILGRMMVEMGFNRTKLATVVITAAAVGDAVGWVLLATVAAVARADFSARDTAAMVGLTVGFFAAMLLVVRPVLVRYFRATLAKSGGELDLTATAVLLVVLLACATATNLIGIFAIFGAFLLGAVLSDQAAFRDAVVARMRDFVTSFFLPIFFTYTGLRTDIASLGSQPDGALWMVCGAVILAALVGKFVGCGVAARLSGFSSREAAVVGVLMNTRALMELIVINIGYDLGVIPKSLFCVLVLMAILTTVMTCPILLALRRGTEIEGPIERSGFLRRG